MLKQQKIFFDFLRFCIGSDSEIPSSLKETDWKELYRIAQKQCLVGILFDGIQVSEWFRKKGFRTCILKGQGLACLSLGLLFLLMRSMVFLC